jgi:predicted NodU family carbamoyl transferase
MPTNILGISAFYHHSAACLIRDGHIVAAAQEERFTRKKFDVRFPANAIRYCLQAGSMQLGDLKYFLFYDKPLSKFERLLETYVAFSPKGIKSFFVARPVWLKEKLLLKSILGNELVLLDGLKKTELPPMLFGEHHESHAASAFYPSPVLRKRVSDYLELDTDSPYMLLVAPVVEKRRTQLTQEQKSLWGIDLLNVPKSDIPAATHVDYSARVQTVHQETNPRYNRLIKAFESKTGCGLPVK